MLLRFVLLPAEVLAIAFEIFLPLRQLAVFGLEGPRLAFGQFERLFGLRFVGLESSSLPIPRGAFRFEIRPKGLQILGIVQAGRSLVPQLAFARIELGRPGGRRRLAFGGSCRLLFEFALAGL